MYIRSLVLATLLPLVTSRMSYQRRIPNGHLVPFPCKPGKIWSGVGHLIDAGSGTRNPFGQDFEDAGHRWTKELCLKDSDGDGLYNGLELGDPNCVWKVNKPVEMKEGLSHPGICDPWDAEMCLNKHINNDNYETEGDNYETQGEWLVDACKSDGLDCPALNDKDIMNITARLPEGTPVPPQKTFYICRTFNLHQLGIPRDRDHHVVAVTPVLGNKQVVHHMALFACTGYIEAVEEPYPCQIIPSPYCQNFIHVWSMGMDGECFYPTSGVRIGKDDLEYVVIQYHWTNLDERTDLTDSSGLTLHITPNLKPYDAAVFLVGSTFFDIPGRKNRTIIRSNCASGCTKALIKGSINITSAWNHMHTLGRDMIIEVLRNGAHVAYITYERIYSYDSPQVFTKRQPLELFSGDTIITTCGFNTSSRQDDIYWGDGTLDEMCFGFMTYFPRQNLTSSVCIDIIGMGICETNSMEGCTSLREFMTEIGGTRAFKEIRYACTEPSSCEPQCASTVLKHMKREPCMRGNIWRYIQDELAKARGDGYEFLSRIAPCKREAEKAIRDDTDTKRLS